MASDPVISLSLLPSGPTVVFRDSSFFSRNGKDSQLPSLADVLALSAIQNTPHNHEKSKPRPVFFHSLGLVVKFGLDNIVSTSEGQCLWALRRFVPDVPVPEIYGWSTEGGYALLYIELVRGVTVEHRWSSMTMAEKLEFSREMKITMYNLRAVRQDSLDRFLGQINRAPYTDRSITHSGRPSAGPFSSAKEFHDWLSRTVRQAATNWAGCKDESIPDPYRSMLPDDAKVVFTHADLHPSNIIVDDRLPSKILAIIDWEQSGWYPGYWEFGKAEYTADLESDWYDYMTRFLEEPVGLDGFLAYTRALGY